MRRAFVTVLIRVFRVRWPSTAFPTNFTKQNASDELVYRPWKWLDVGAAYEWERFRHVYGGDSDEVRSLAPPV